MEFVEFTGKLDDAGASDSTGFVPFTGKLDEKPGLIDTVIGTLKEVPNTVSSMLKEDRSKMYERGNVASQDKLAAQDIKASPDLVSDNKTFGSDISQSLGKAALKVPGALASTADALIGGGELNTDSPIGVLTSLPGFAIKKATGTSTPFRDAAGYWGDVTGFKPGEAAKYIEGEEMKSGLSKETQTQKKATEKAWEESKTDNFAIKLIDFVSGGKSTAADVKDAWSKADMSYVAQALIDNPRVPLLTVIESVPSIIAGGGLSRATSLLALKSGVKLPGYMAGAIGEGMITSGMTVDELVDKGVPRERALQAGRWAGAITGGVSGASGKLAGKLGLEDIDSLMAGKATEKVANRIPLSVRTVGGTIQEGVEEGVQSAQETMWQNWAEKNPLGKGVVRAAVEGAIAGSMMGAGSNVYGGIKEIAEGKPAAPAAEVPPPAAPEAKIDQQIQTEQQDSNDLLAQVKALHPEQAVETIQAQPDVDSAIQAAKAFIGATTAIQGEIPNIQKTAEAIPLETKQPEAPAAGLIQRGVQDGIQPERANAEVVAPGAEVAGDVLPGGRPAEQAPMPSGTGGRIQPAEVSAPGGGEVATVRNVEQSQAVTHPDISAIQRIKPDTIEVKAKIAPEIVGEKAIKADGNRIGERIRQIAMDNGLLSTYDQMTGNAIIQTSGGKKISPAMEQKIRNEINGVEHAPELHEALRQDRVDSLVEHYKIPAYLEDGTARPIEEVERDLIHAVDTHLKDVHAEHQAAIDYAIEAGMKDQQIASIESRVAQKQKYQGDLDGHPEKQAELFRETASLLRNAADERQRILGTVKNAPRTEEARSGEAGETRAAEARPTKEEIEKYGVDPGGRLATSWILRNKETGEVIMETFDRKKVDALNTKKYEAVPALKYLAELNKKEREPTAKPTEPEVKQKAYASQKEATLKANMLTRQGYPSVAEPHPTEANKWVINEKKEGPLLSRGVEPTRTPKEVAKDRSELKSIFDGLGRSLGTAPKKAKEAAADHPKSEIINHIQTNFYDILATLESAGKVEINC